MGSCLKKKQRRCLPKKNHAFSSSFLASSTATTTPRRRDYYKPSDTRTSHPWSCRSMRISRYAGATIEFRRSRNLRVRSLEEARSSRRFFLRPSDFAVGSGGAPGRAACVGNRSRLCLGVFTPLPLACRRRGESRRRSPCVRRLRGRRPQCCPTSTGTVVMRSRRGGEMIMVSTKDSDARARQVILWIL